MLNTQTIGIFLVSYNLAFNCTIVYIIRHNNVGMYKQVNAYKPMWKKLSGKQFLRASAIVMCFCKWN